MSKTSSNKGIYLFWGGIAIVVAVVLLIIFLPRTNAGAPLATSQSVASQIERKDSLNKNIDFYITSFLNDPLTDSTQKQNLSALYSLQQSLVASNTFSQNALLYVTPAEDFKALSKEQQSKADTFSGTLSAFQNYCSLHVSSLFDGTVFTNRTFTLNETLNVFYDKYQVVLKEMANFYYTTAQIVSSSAMLCMEINTTMKQKHLELSETIYNLAQSGMVSIPSASNALSTAQTIYAEGYYKSFI